MKLDYLTIGCVGYCHNCSSITCSNHPENYDDVLSYVSNFVFEPGSVQYNTLSKMMNKKLALGLGVMEYMDESEYYAIDYVITDRDRELYDYAQSIINKIEQELGKEI